jgi:hypothetical protein
MSARPPEDAIVASAKTGTRAPLASAAVAPRARSTRRFTGRDAPADRRRSTGRQGKPAAGLDRGREARTRGTCARPPRAARALGDLRPRRIGRLGRGLSSLRKGALTWTRARYGDSSSRRPVRPRRGRERSGRRDAEVERHANVGRTSGTIHRLRRVRVGLTGAAGADERDAGAVGLGDRGVMVRSGAAGVVGDARHLSCPPARRGGGALDETTVSAATARPRATESTEPGLTGVTHRRRRAPDELVRAPCGATSITASPLRLCGAEPEEPRPSPTAWPTLSRGSRRARAQGPTRDAGARVDMEAIGPSKAERFRRHD